ncbi:MAG: DNA alkylation repair protein [Candidatus Bathyarchaeia archaeon]
MKEEGRLGMVSVDEVLERLKAKARSDRVEGMARYGMVAERRLGVSVPEMRRIAKEVGKDHGLALGLWETGIPEARILAAMVDEPKKLTEEQMEDLVKDFNSWDVCDQVCMNLFEKTPLVWKKIPDWSEREEEFVKRTAFTLIACLAWHDKKAEDEKFIELFPVIKGGATDERNYVKKAVNWALRNIGKRNPNLNKAAIETAREIQRIDSKAARWIASNAIKELESEAVRRRLRKLVS